MTVFPSCDLKWLMVNKTVSFVACQMTKKEDNSHLKPYLMLVVV